MSVCVWLCGVCATHTQSTLSYTNAPEDGPLRSKACWATECYE